MITKTVIKDYVSKKCPYLVKMELEDKTLVQLLENSIESRKKYLELVEEDKEVNNESGEDDEGFNLPEILRDYPHLKKIINKYEKNLPKNAVEELIEQYNDDQIVSKISRIYWENKYGKENCRRCDVNEDGETFLDQDAVIHLTNRYLKDPSVKVIFEGQIEYKDLRARFDVLIKNGDGSYSIVEVKGTNDVFKHPSKDKEIDKGIKEKYLYDLLFQYHIYLKVHPNIKSLFYMYTNPEYELKKETYPISADELDDFFVLKDFINLEDGPISLRKYFDSDGYIDEKLSEEEKEEVSIEGILNRIHAIEKQVRVQPQMSYFCRKGPACPFISMCFGEEAEQPNSIFKLTNWGSYGGYFGRTKKVIDAGIKKISEINPELFEFKEKKKNGDLSNAYSQIMYQKGLVKEKYLLKMSKIEEILLMDYLNDEIQYLLFFDFESFQYPIPLVKHTGPWKQVVSQYSMHIVKKGYDLSKHDFAKGNGGDCKHYEFIANPDETKYENPSIDLYTTLKSQLEDFGIDPMAKNYRVVVFNQNFEKTRMNEFVQDFATLADVNLLQFVRNFNENVVDLLDFFTSGGMYSRDFNGRGSLKVVQPTLADDEDVKKFYQKILPFDLAYSLDYHKGEKCLVYNGGICLDLYKSLLVRSHLGETNPKLKTKDLLAEALAYCKIDSWGTVIIYDVIKNTYLGKLKLDAKIV